MWLKIPYSGLGLMGNFGEPIALENLIHPLVWWLLGLRSGLRDYVFIHLWFLAVYHGRRVLAALLLYVVVLIIIIVPIVTVLVIVTKAVVR